MSIQQNLNQMLGTVAAGTAFWAHTEGGKKYLKTRQLKKDIKQTSEMWQNAPTQEVEDAAYEKQRDLELELAEVNPTTQEAGSVGSRTAFERAAEIKQEKAEEADYAKEQEKKAIKSAEEADIKNIRQQALVQSILQGTPSAYILDERGGKK